MKVKAVFELEMPDELINRCQARELKAYDDMLKIFVDDINREIKNKPYYNDMEYIEHYRFYDDFNNIIYRR